MRKMTLVAASIIAQLSVALPQAALAQADMMDGQVTKVDESAGKITIRHGPMPKFGFDEPHTMVFRAQDPTMLKGVKAGDKIKFEADRVNGQFTVMKMQKAK
jgi:Cu(I)/Ag(I) efflux system protein CusF